MLNWPRSRPKAVPINYRSRAIPKFQAMKAIVSTGSVKKAEDLQKFQTDEQISIEISVSQNNTNPSCSLQKQQKQPVSHSNNNAPNLKKKLCIFNCDSISIRPNQICNSLNQHNGIASQSGNISMNYSSEQILKDSLLASDNPNKSNKAKQNTTSSDNSHNANTKQVPEPYPLNDSKLNNSQQFILGLLQEPASGVTSSIDNKDNKKCMKLGNSRKRPRQQIFAHRNGDKQKRMHGSIPECYMLDGYQNGDVQTEWGRNQKILNRNADQLFNGREMTYRNDADVEFHIVFEADEVLQCCL